ncbi:MAG: hypothetical protein IJT94_11370 [Oscillibacter sp.]|nr:hypothetical protein [Oscillibacter sp.]
MDLPEPVRSQAIAELAKAYLPHYARYERYSLVGKDVIRDNKPSVYNYISAKTTEHSMFLDGFKAAAEVLGISLTEFLEAVAAAGKDGAS